MKKNLLTIGALALTISCVNAQVLSFLGDNSSVYVSKGTLYYNGGGVQIVNKAVFENHGNVMVSGASGDKFITTVDGTLTNNKTEANAGGNFINKLNEETAYAQVNTNNATATPVYTYGQLYITGLNQSDVQGYVDQEYRQVNQGAYQQIGIPFYNKTMSTLGTELGANFNTTRWSGSEILQWNNQNVVFDNMLGMSSTFGSQLNYYILGAGSGASKLDVASQKRTVKGRPFTDEIANVQKKLSGAGVGLNFGAGGNNINGYNEKYNTYLQDTFTLSSGGTAWDTNFGKNIYQFSNPFLTNLDLSTMSTLVPNLRGIRLEVSGVQYTPNAGGGSTSFKWVAPNGTSWAGDVDYLMIRPMGTFVLKLNDNVAQPTVNFANLRRMAYYGGTASVASAAAQGSSQSIMAAKEMSSSTIVTKASYGGGTLKQLGIIGLDASGNELERTYYVVSPSSVTGKSDNATSQVDVPSGGKFGTYEEALNGGYNGDYSYWLYINEANESDFRGKNVMMVNYNPNIVAIKFEIREDAKLLDNGAGLSTGEKFYYKSASGDVIAINQGDMTKLNGTEYNVYYGAPNSGTLGTDNIAVSTQKTVVAFDPNVNNYVVKFANNWKTAEVSVYDASGRLVSYGKNINTSSNYTINLNSGLKGVYIVKVVGDNKEIISSKIINK